jgi:acyl transferase domain-containing protein
MPDGIPDEIQYDSRTSLTEALLSYPGTAKSIYANRISFIFDFKGPSMVIDTACSSSMVALDVAITDLRTGEPFFELFKIRKQLVLYNKRFQTD